MPEKEYQRGEIITTINDLLLLIKLLMKQKFYGGLELKFEAGNIIYCFQGESIKTSVKRET